MERINGEYWQNDTASLTPIFNMEADLDFEYSMALTYPQPVISYQVGEQWQIGSLNSLLAALDPSYCTASNSSIDGTYPSSRYVLRVETRDPWTVARSSPLFGHQEGALVF